MKERGKLGIFNGNTAQSTASIAVLIILMLVFILLYIISLPPEDREELLDLDTNNSSSGEGRIVRLTVEVDEFFLEPDFLSVDKNERVRLTFENTGRRDIVCEVEEFDEATSLIEPDETDQIRFTANKKGSFEFTCKVKGLENVLEGEFEVL